MFWSGRGDLERKRVRDKRLGGTRVRDKVGRVWLILGGISCRGQIERKEL